MKKIQVLAVCKNQHPMGLPSDKRHFSYARLVNGVHCLWLGPVFVSWKTTEPA